ncbi:hypothetical protein BC829DRAFT_355014, partial [Chytridium lagenaria]
CTHPLCTLTFPSRDRLKSHRRIHRRKRDFPCRHPGCIKILYRKQDRDRHESTHLEIKPFECGLGCGRRFARRDGVVRH